MEFDLLKKGLKVLFTSVQNDKPFLTARERLRQAQPDSRYQPTVSVSTKKTKNSVTISVSDSGNGIPQSIVDKIFQPTYRAGVLHPPFTNALFFLL